VERSPERSMVTFDYLTRTILKGPGHTLENIFKHYFLEDMEKIYNDTHVNQRENEKTYNYESKKMSQFRFVVSSLLLFCDKFPLLESSMNYYKYQRDFNKIMSTAVTDATEFLKENASDVVGDGCKMSVGKFVDAMKKMNKLGKLDEKKHPLGTTHVLTKMFKLA